MKKNKTCNYKDLIEYLEIMYSRMAERYEKDGEYQGYVCYNGALNILKEAKEIYLENKEKTDEK